MSNYVNKNPIILQSTGAVNMGTILVKSILFWSDTAGYGSIADVDSKTVVLLRVDGVTKFNESICFGDNGTYLDVDSVTLVGTNPTLYLYT